MKAKTVTILVAAIGAAATVGAALVSRSDKPDTPAPGTQQTSYGAGAINVGRDATFNNTVSKTPGEEAAERVQACEARHGMNSATERTEQMQRAAGGGGDANGMEQLTLFRSCAWPAPAYADGDGFAEIKDRIVEIPGRSEADGDDEADRIGAPCARVALVYQYGSQGDYQNGIMLKFRANTVNYADGRPPPGNAASLPFYPDDGEIVVLRSGRYLLARASCA